MPLPLENILMLIPFQDNKDACDAVTRLYSKQNISPSGLEFMELDALKFVRDQEICQYSI